ncbi:hypothetical protein I79_010777 [Cricetulus griseus]|uniref:Uncharacterized protein n=1 Tax=Cricetulus griseus TaxID=10029 RepID=G3HJD5_CRIGR|nr:hypothetical protein I79_010777 [Cricetulus griseus]
MGLARGSQVFVGVVDEVASRAIGTAALEVELVAEFRFVLGVSIGLAQFTQAVGKLALGPVSTTPALRVGPTELGLVPGGGGGGGGGSRSRRSR